MTDFSNILSLFFGEIAYICRLNDNEYKLL